MSTSRYKAELVKLVSFKDDKKDDVGRNVTTEELLCITPDLLCRWMNKRAYGDPEPNEDMIPIHTRSSTLEIAKKAISAFMPRLNTKALPSHDDDLEERSNGIIYKFVVRKYTNSTNKAVK
ncbi:hypothetical protein GQ600_2852 [Phytophthora cactorum]|nr:hypothetical protein GQ600_2852 [Phytophthora cactorum]